MEVLNIEYNPVKHISQRKAAELLGISVDILSKNRNNPDIRWFRRNGARIYYFSEDIMRNAKRRDLDNRINVTYVRGLNIHGADSVAYQLSFIDNFIAKNYPDCKIDMAYIDYCDAYKCNLKKRKELHTLMGCIQQKLIRNIFVLTPNRISYTDSAIFEAFCAYNGTNVIYCTNKESPKYFSEETSMVVQKSLRYAANRV